MEAFMLCDNVDLFFEENLGLSAVHSPIDVERFTLNSKDGTEGYYYNPETKEFDIYFKTPVAEYYKQKDVLKALMPELRATLLLKVATELREVN